MTAPVAPDPGPGWFSAYLRSALPRGEPADATAVRPRPTPASFRDYLHALRQSVGGAVEGAGEASGQIAEMVSPAVGGPLFSPLAPLLQAITPAANALAARAGDVVGGRPKNVSDSSFRQLGNAAGNLAAWEGVSRAPALLRRLAGGSKTRGADQFRRALEAADAQQGRNQVVKNSFLGRPIRPEVAPLTVIPSNPIPKLPAEMNSLEREVNDALVSLGAVRTQQVRGTAVHPLEQQVKQRRYQEALAALGATPAQPPEKLVAAVYSTLRDPKTGDYYKGLLKEGQGHKEARDAAKAAGLTAGFEERNSGFLTDRGNFVTRQEALQMARNARQLQRPVAGPLTSEAMRPAAQVFGREEAPWFKLISQELPR